MNKLNSSQWNLNYHFTKKEKLAFVYLNHSHASIELESLTREDINFPKHYPGDNDGSRSNNIKHAKRNYYQTKKETTQTNAVKQKGTIYIVQTSQV